jgi:tRNA-splicing ligase RtcB
MKARQLEVLGIPRGEIMAMALRAVGDASHLGLGTREIRSLISAMVENPADFRDDPSFGPVAQAMLDSRMAIANAGRPGKSAPYRVWGSDIDPKALAQLENACSLPVALRAALMPDAHVGYGLPIGGVLATRNAVVPYAVGVDIACRMKLTVLDLPASALDDRRPRLKEALLRETLFGVGAEFKRRRNHAVMDAGWGCSPVTEKCKDKAWAQLGTSGSGNHFVEFGTLTVAHALGDLAPGIYLALLSHSGSRGTGAEVCRYYSALAKSLHRELSKELSYLAWLDLDRNEGREYWAAMELMGAYAAANHELVHAGVARNLGAQVLLDIENYHNFAWRERYDGQEVVVHRKGATPAHAGVLGIIPGSMGTPGYVVRGRGNEASLNSASHGAGRRMSRHQAKEQLRWNDLNAFLTERGIELISAGLDESPAAYKNIGEVMAAQADLVEVLARFDPKIVRMAPGHERTED